MGIHQKQNMLRLTSLLLLLFLITVGSAQESTTTIDVQITNIKNDKGQVLIGLYNAEADWLNTHYRGAFAKIKNRSCLVTFDSIPNGTYAISVFHDKDNDGELDTIFGIPSEDFGSSNNAPANFGPPKWKAAKFEVNGTPVRQEIKL